MLIKITKRRNSKEKNHGLRVKHGIVELKFTINFSGDT